MLTKPGVMLELRNASRQARHISDVPQDFEVFQDGKLVFVHYS